MKTTEPVVIPSEWVSLRRFTDARIALGRAGHSVPTEAHLNFQLAHAQARDAVHLPLDAIGVAQSIQALGFSTLALHSAAIDRHTYLQRPDLGRKLDARSLKAMGDWKATHEKDAQFDVSFVIADGLSALAIHQNAVPFFSAVVALLRDDAHCEWTIAPVAVVEQGRVALADEIGEILRANATVILIGERPGLSSPDSMGVYLTWEPKVGRNDSQRNCISNIRTAGLSADTAAAKLHHLLTRSRMLGLTGIALKDDTGDLAEDRLSAL